MEYFSGFFLRAGSVKNDVDIADFLRKDESKKDVWPFSPTLDMLAYNGVY